jgi:hypothetical protein
MCNLPDAAIRWSTLPALAGAVLAVGLLATAPAHAQIGITDASERPLIGADARAKAPPKLSAAPALPGAQSNPDEVAKATNTDLPPTQALFDAVNRGDIASARDAIGRGADLSAHNVLGLTPLDLSVDLGRNDITFLLLSLRGSSAPPATLAAAGPPPKPGKPVRAAAMPRAPAPRQAAPLTATRAAADAPLRHYVSTDPGTPAPQVGFLGFAGH